MPRPRILVLGDGMLDVWHIGTSTRQSAEVPIPIVKITDTVTEPGGAGNVLMNLLTLGADAVRAYGEGPVKHRLVLDGKQIARWDEHDYCTAPMFDEDIAGFDGFVISDYGKGGLDTEVLPFMSGPFFIDSKRSPYEFTRILSTKQLCFFPNEQEYNQYKDEYQSIERSGPYTVIHKRGALGLRYGKHEFVALCKNPVSVCGAGDSVVAAFAKRYLDTHSIREAAIYANAAAASVCSKPYTSTTTEAEIAALFGKGWSEKQNGSK